MTPLVLVALPSLPAIRAFFQANLTAILPELELVLFAIGIVLMDAWVHEKDRRWNPALALAGVSFSGLTLWMLRAQTARAEVTGFHQLIEDDSYFIFFAALLLIGAALVILLSINAPIIHENARSRYYALLLLATAGLMPMLASSDLLVIFFSLELCSICLYFLVATPGGSGRSSPAVLKFLFSSAFGSASLLYGFSLLYGLTGSANLVQIAASLGRRYNVARVIALSHQPGAHGAQMYQLLQSRLPEAVNWHPFVLHILPAAALLFVLIGLLVKLLSFPFQRLFAAQNFSAPLPVILFLAGPFCIAIFALILRMSPFFVEPRKIWAWVLPVFAMALLICNMVKSLRQKNLDRIFIYSLLAQIGFVLLAMDPTQEEAYTDISYYLFTYLFIVAGTFAVLLALRHSSGVTELADLRGLRRDNPIAAVLLFVFIIALCGLPPTAGFYGRYLLFRSLLEAGHRYLAWFGAAAALLLAYSYLRIGLYSWRGPRPAGDDAQTRQVTFGLPESVVIGVCLFVSLAAGLYSDPFLRVARYAFGQ